MIELTILEATENIEKYQIDKGMEGQKGGPKGHKNW
jgi:hypothetical protein